MTHERSKQRRENHFDGELSSLSIATPIPVESALAEVTLPNSNKRRAACTPTATDVGLDSGRSTIHTNQPNIGKPSDDFAALEIKRNQSSQLTQDSGYIACLLDNLITIIADIIKKIESAITGAPPQPSALGKKKLPASE